MKENKYQEALNYLKGGNLFGELSNDGLISIEELIDKETPMKPLDIEPCHYECGKCCSTILPIGQKRTWHKQINKYCPNCGQAIDWSYEE